MNLATSVKKYIYYVFREDIEFSTASLLNIVCSCTDVIKHYDICTQEFFMHWKLHSLDLLETKLIDQSIEYKWLVYNGEYVGIIVMSDIDQTEYFNDFMTLNEFALNRKNLNEMKSSVEDEEIEETIDIINDTEPED